MNETAKSGYSQERYAVATKRYCQMLKLHNDEELIKRYVAAHSPEQSWPEISQGIRSVGILSMEIYINENNLFMIVETEADFEWDSAFERLASMDRQAEWEEYVSQFQIAEEGLSSADKWTLMPRIFTLLK